MISDTALAVRADPIMDPIAVACSVLLKVHNYIVTEDFHEFPDFLQVDSGTLTDMGRNIFESPFINHVYKSRIHSIRPVFT
jgi:hypothetical protein